MIRQARKLARAHSRRLPVPATAPRLVLGAVVLLWAIAKLAEHLGLACGVVLGQLVLLLGVHEFLQPCCVPLGVRSTTRAAAMRFIRRRLARRAPTAVDAVSSETTCDPQPMEEPAGVSPSSQITTLAHVTETADKGTDGGGMASRLAGAPGGFVSDDKAASAESSARRYCESVDMTASESSGDEGDDEQTHEMSTKPDEGVQRVGSSTKSARERQDAWTTAHVVRYESDVVRAAAGTSAEESLRANWKRTLSPELLTTLEPAAQAKETATPRAGVKQAIQAFEARSLDSFRAGVDAEHTFTTALETKPRPDTPAVSIPEKVARSTPADTRAEIRTESTCGWGAVARPAARKIDVQQAAGWILRRQGARKYVAKRASYLVRTKSTPSVIATKCGKEVSVAMASGERPTKILEGPKPSERTLTHAEAMIKFFSKLEERNRALSEASRVRRSSGTSSCASVRTDPGTYTEQKFEQKAKEPSKSAGTADAAADAMEPLARSTVNASELAEVESETVLAIEVSEVVQSDSEPVSREVPSHALEGTTSAVVDQNVEQSDKRGDKHSESVSLTPFEPSGVAAEPMNTDVPGESTKVVLEPESQAGSINFGNPETPVVIEGDAAKINAEVTEDPLDLEKLDNICVDVTKIVEPATESKSSSSDELKALTSSKVQVADRDSPGTSTGAKNGLAYLMDLDDVYADTNTTLSPVEADKSSFPEELGAAMAVEDDATEDDSRETYTRSSEGLVYLAESDDAYNEARMMLEPDGVERSQTAAEEKASVAVDDDAGEERPELSEELLALADDHVKATVTTRGMSRSEAMADFFRSLAEGDNRLHRYRHPVFFQVMSIQLRLRRFSVLPSELTGLPDFRSSYASNDDSMEPQPERVEL